MNYQDRMREELKDLGEKVDRIAEFIDSATYDALEDGDQVLLLSQSIAMANYHMFLEERVRRL